VKYVFTMQLFWPTVKLLTDISREMYAQQLTRYLRLISLMQRIVFEMDVFLGRVDCRARKPVKRGKEPSWERQPHGWRIQSLRL
jgi:hypothetical protein